MTTVDTLATYTEELYELNKYIKNTIIPCVEKELRSPSAAGEELNVAHKKLQQAVEALATSVTLLKAEQ